MTALLDASAGVQIADDLVRRAKEAGADEAQALHGYSELFEITFDNDEIGLIRTTINDSVSLKVFVGGAMGSSSLTGRSHDLMDKAAAEAVAAARGGEADPANKIAEGPSTELTEMGDREPDKDAMLDTAMRHVDLMAKEYPKIVMRDSTYQFVNSWRSFANSAGRTHQERRSGYAATSIFSGKDGERTTSFNYTSATLPTPFEIIEMATLRRLLDETMASFDPQPVPDTFVGDVILTPDSLDTVVGPLLGAIGGYSLIRGTSPYKERLGEVIASPQLTITNTPLSPEFPLASHFDGDGVPAFDLPIVSEGRLESFLIDWYASNKLDRPQTAGVSNVWVAPGHQSFDEIVAGTERGIILNRFSGGSPNQKLDFSGVAKNSFYVEDGEVRHPIAETMVAGNLADLIGDIRAVGSTSVNYGGHAFPALAAGGVTISRK